MSASEAATAPERRAHILVIDDDNLQRMILREIAGKVGFDTTGAASYEEAVELLGYTDYDCITLDLSLGGRSGLELLQLFKHVHCETPIIVISSSPQTVVNLVVGIGNQAKLNMCEPMGKPVDLARLAATLTRIKEDAAKKPAAGLSLAGWTTSVT